MSADVREALARVLHEMRHPCGEAPVDVDYERADIVLAAFEVRPRRTVTDAEVEAAAACLGERFGHSGEHYVDDARAALEAARKARL